METRKAPRVEIKLRVISKIADASQKFSIAGGRIFEVETADISTLGMGIFSPYFLPRGLMIELEADGAPFGLKEPIHAKGEVRYCKYIKVSVYRCGIKFTRIAPEHKNKIAEFIAAYERRGEPRIKLSD